jgi:hypothetical protein
MKNLTLMLAMFCVFTALGNAQTTIRFDRIEPARKARLIVSGFPTDTNANGYFFVQYKLGEELERIPAVMKQSRWVAKFQKPAGSWLLKVVFAVTKTDETGKEIVRASGFMRTNADIGSSDSVLEAQIGSDDDGDGFSAFASDMTASAALSGWRILRDVDDNDPAMNPLTEFQLRAPANDNRDPNGDGVEELEWDNKTGIWDLLGNKFREGWIGLIPGPYEPGERVIEINLHDKPLYVIAFVIRGVR